MEIDEIPESASAAAAEGEAPTAAAPADGGAALPAEAAPTGMQRVWREWIRPFLVILVVMGSLRSAVADWNDVPTGSMKPTIVEGDRIFVNKAAYGLRVPFTLLRIAEWGAPARGDIVVLFSPADGKRLVKRVVGLPGDRVQLAEGRLLINGVAAEYGPLPEAIRDQVDDYQHYRFAEENLGGVVHPIMLTPWVGAPHSYGPVEVPPGKYFVMGDNRDNSRDSRYFGFVDRERIVGHALAVVASLDPLHHYLPRWSRFFHKLP